MIEKSKQFISPMALLLESDLNTKKLKGKQWISINCNIQARLSISWKISKEKSIIKVMHSCL